MAKQQKGGLGRGLSSLISDSYEESVQAQNAGQQAVKTKEKEILPPAAEPTPPQRAAAERELVETPEELRELQEALLEKVREREGKSQVKQQNEPEEASQEPSEAPVVEEVDAPAEEPAPAPEDTPKEAPKDSRPRKSVPAEKKERTTRIASEDEVQIAEEHVTIKGVATREAAEPKAPQQDTTIDPDANHINPNPVEQRYVGTNPTDEVPIDMVVPNPNQPRTNFKNDELDELAGSIERSGLLQPILVRETGDGKYQIIAGERRWQACKQLGMKTVPIRIKEASDNEALELALVENIQRSDLNPIEEAWGYRRLMEKKGLTQTQLAQTLSKGRSTIANALRLLDLPEDAQQLLFEEKITAGHARAILSVPTTEGRQKLAEKLVAEKLSVRETENIARLMAAKKQPKAAAEKSEASKAYALAARALKTALGTNVKVKASKGKNKIEIEFKDEKDLQRIVKSIVNE